MAHLTSLRVVQVETELRPTSSPLEHPTASRSTLTCANTRPLGTEPRFRSVRCRQRILASTDPLVIVEGAAGAGKTTMLATAIRATEHQGGSVRVVAPTKRAAEVAHQELGVPAESVAALVYAHGWR